MSRVEMVMEALGTAVLHSVWQGAAIGAVAGLVLAWMRERSAGSRYAVACAALCACAVAFVGSFVWGLVGEPGLGRMSGAIGAVGVAPAAASDASRGAVVVEWVAWAWVLGVAALWVRLCAQCVCAKRLARVGVSEAGGEWGALFDELQCELGMGRVVRLVRSTVADVPMVVGWFRPVVVVPVSVLTGMTPEQVRALLAHELWHIRRHDHWVNAVQLVIETVLFFHPVVWWLSGRIRAEREHCCDDAAVRLSGSPLVFAEALAELESLRVARTTAAVAANGGSLMERIARIVGVKHTARVKGAGWRAAAGVAAGAMIAAAGLAQAASGWVDDDDDVVRLLRQLATSQDSTERVRELYDTLVYRGSEIERTAQVEMERLETDLRDAVAAGEISEAQAAEKLEGAHRKLRDHLDMRFAMDVLGQSKSEAYLSVTRRNVHEALLAGRMTPAEAEAALSAATLRTTLHEDLAGQLARTEAEIKRALAAGKMTAAEGEAKLVEARRLAEARAQLAEAAAKIKESVAAGEVSAVEGSAHVRAIHDRLATEHDPWHAGPAGVVHAQSAAQGAHEVHGVHKGHNPVASHDVMHTHEADDAHVRHAHEIKDAIASGRISRADGLRALADLQVAFGGEAVAARSAPLHDQQAVGANAVPRTATGPDVDALEAKVAARISEIEARVARGEVSRVEATRELRATKEEIARVRALVVQQRSLREKQQALANRMAEVEDLLVAEQISRAEGQARLADLHAELADVQRSLSAQDALRARQSAAALRVREIEALMRAGEVSKEQGARMIEKLEAAKRGDFAK